MEKLIQERISKAISEKVFPGCVVGWIRDGEKRILPSGNFTYDKNSTRINENTIYDIASITKVIPSSSSVLALIDSGKINLSDPVVKFIPEFGNYPDKKEVTIKHLLTYTLDLVIPSMAGMTDKSAKEIIDIVLNAPLRAKPGESFLYTNSTAILFGLIVERVSGKRLDGFAKDYFFDPLGMHKSTFHPLNNFKKEEIAPTEISDWRGGLLQGVVHDESTYVLQQAGYYLGAAGMFSTVPDILKFAEMILNEGSINSKKFFSKDLFMEITKDQLNKSDWHYGWGWEMNTPEKMGKYNSEIIGKYGFTGCMLLINLKKKSCVVILSNAVYPKRPADIEPRYAFRRDIADIIFKP